VLDCTDNVAVRNQLNAGCFAHKTPLVSGAAIRMEGQISVFTYAEGEPCYRCLSRLFGENALTCVEAGVMAPLVGVIGSLQAMEAIKVLAHYGTPAGKIVMYDAMTCQFREMKLMRNPGCEVCSKANGGGSPYPTSLERRPGRPGIRQPRQIDVRPNAPCQSCSNFTIAASTAGEVINCCATSSGSVMDSQPASRQSSA
jgi:hypothetical protein